MKSIIKKENGKRIHFQEEEEEHFLNEDDFLDEEEKGDIPDHAWKQFVLGRERHGLIQIITCQNCGYKTSYSSLRIAILEHLNAGCTRAFGSAMNRQPIEDAYSAPTEEIKSVPSVQISDPFRLQKFNVAENRRLKVPSQYLLKDETIQEMRFKEKQSIVKQGGNNDLSNPSTGTDLNSDFYGQIVDHMSDCSKRLKELEMERNSQLLQENYSRAIETWKWRQTQIHQRIHENKYEIKRVTKFTRMPLVQRFSRPPPLTSLIKKEDTGSIKTEDTTEETADSIIEVSESEEDDDAEDFENQLADDNPPRKRIPQQFRSQSLFNRLNKSQMIKTATFQLTIDEALLKESHTIKDHFVLPHISGIPAKVRFNCTIPKVSTIPTSCFYLKIEENQGTEDQITFRSVPYLGDDIRLDLGEFNRITGNIPGQIEPEVCGESGELLVAYYLERGQSRNSSSNNSAAVVSFGNGEDQIQQGQIIPEIIRGLAVILEVSVKEILRIYKIISESSWYRNHINPRKQLTNSLDRIIGYEDHIHCASLLSLIGLDESSFNPDERNHVECGIGIGLGILNVPNYLKMVSNYRDFFCRRCYILNCSDHLIQHPLPQERVDPTPPLLCPFTKLVLPNDFIRFNRRSQLVSNRYLVEAFPIKQEKPGMKLQKKGDEQVRLLQEECSRSVRKSKSFVDKLRYDSNRQAIVVMESNEEVKEVKARIPILQDCEMFEWLEGSEKQFINNPMNYCLPCEPFGTAPTTSNHQVQIRLSSSTNVQSRKRSLENHSDLQNFQPLYRDRLRVDRPTAVIEALESHPIVKSLELLPASSFDSSSPIKKHQRTNQLVKLPSSLSRVTSNNTNSMVINLVFDDDDDDDEEEDEEDRVIPSPVKRQKTNKIYSSPSPATAKPSTPPINSQFVNRKRKFQLSFHPPLADSELALIEKLATVYPTLKPFSTPFYKALPYEEFFTTRSTGDQTSISQFPYNQMLAQELRSAEKIPLVKFIAETLQTRQIEEIVRVIQERDWLFIQKDQDPSTSYQTLQGNQSNGLESNLMELEDKDYDDEDEKMIESDYDDDRDEDAMVIFTTTGNNTSSNNSNKLNIQTNHHSYQACGHLGPCSNDNKNCSCVQFGTFCEKYCCCDSKRCRRRFKGCNCSRGLCQTKACPCFAANRACDPDACATCGASVHPLQLKILQARLRNEFNNSNSSSHNETRSSLSINRGDHHSSSAFTSTNSSTMRALPRIKDLIDLTTEELSKGQQLKNKAQSLVSSSTTISNLKKEDLSIELKICSNLPFYLHTPKKICVKPSAIHGWGAYAMEPIEKHDFVIEYKGEIINQDEADRRGIIYDQLNLSYLFNITNESVLDATRKGNKAKFLNHSDNPNCVTRVMQIFGDHKVGIFAKRDIAIGEELTFDYCYDRHVPKWLKGKSTSAVGSRIQKKTSSKNGGSSAAGSKSKR